MAISYTWDVNKCDVFPTKSGKSNVVNGVHWKLLGTDDANNDSNGNPLSYSIYGLVSLDTSDLSSFTNWSSLDAATVQGWVEAALGNDKITALKQNIENVIGEQVSPTQTTKILS
tara:strand:- start:137 stop:481 length:345 start_codon:yes stop_codon:yes gene_type:complete